MLRRLILILFATVMLAVPVRGATADDVLDALDLDEMLRIMRAEGIDYGQDLARDLFGQPGSTHWDAMLDRIYDPARMERTVRARFAEALAEDAAAPLVAYFRSDAGQRVIALELAAREAMIDDDTEEAARAAYRAIDGEDDPTLDMIETFVAQGDLVEANVAGALNASYQFYRGLADGGALQMSERDMLSDVWAQEAETREDTREWLFAFLLMAYEPLDPDLLSDYVAMSGSPEGQALTTALFAAFNDMYDSISYALGLAAAEQMASQEL